MPLLSVQLAWISRRRNTCAGSSNARRPDAGEGHAEERVVVASFGDQVFLGAMFDFYRKKGTIDYQLEAGLEGGQSQLFRIYGSEVEMIFLLRGLPRLAEFCLEHRCW